MIPPRRRPFQLNLKAVRKAMTLNLTIVNSAGIWQSSDHRLVDQDTLKLLDDFSIKHVNLRCPDGAALLAYAGIGRVGAVHLSDWIRETLRGESRSLDQSFMLIRENASRDLGRLLKRKGIRHMFSIGAFLQGRPWAVQIRNFNLEGGLFGPVLDHFETIAKEITGPGRGFVFGDPAAIRPQDQEKLMALAARKPRRPKEFRDLLASINRRAAQTKSGARTVSPHCVTTYIPPAGEPFESEFYDVKGAPRPLVIPVLLFRIDLTEMQRALLGQSNKEAAASHDIERAARDAVSPKNRLRP